MPLTNDQALAHLLRRTGFGPSRAEFLRARADGFSATLQRLLYDDTVSSALDPTGGLGTAFDPTRLDHLRQAWLYRMAFSPQQLREKMTFFWHSHFATSIEVVDDLGFMTRQIEFLRANALGSFRTLLHGIAKDPAMMIFLDTRLNSKNAPNENFAREVMELYTLGEGNGYTEEDVKQAAKTFTGWRFRTSDDPAGRWKKGDFYLDTRQQDTTPKTIFGKPFPYSADQGERFLDLLLQHPNTGDFLARKLFRFFISDSIDEPTVAAVAAAYYASGYSVRAMLETLFTSPVFLSDGAYRCQVKTPLEFLLGLVKQLNLVDKKGQPWLPYPFVVQQLRALGVDLYDPPSVKGWPEGVEWLGTTPLLLRANQVNTVLTAQTNQGPTYFDAVAFCNATGQSTAEGLVTELANRLVDGDISPSFRDALVSYLGQRTAAAAAAQRVFVPVAVTGSALAVQPPESEPPPVNVWNGQGVKVRGMLYLLLASPNYQLN
ncbi:MAG: DUF1800 domain-containing protein [Chloroflexota bacterium]|nr:DUF1800 domain-containing protein [Dehalococcoidia bacterium]MDW8254052.1 DUF1800 domain-containing protein [Chloroflexota bacterium]